MTDEEIKKIARRFELDMYPTMPDMLSAKAMIEWLCKDYAIVSKTQLKELYGCYKQHESVSKEKGLYEAEMIARGSQATMRDIFGESFFEEDKK